MTHTPGIGTVLHPAEGAWVWGGKLQSMPYNRNILQARMRANQRHTGDFPQSPAHCSALGACGLSPQDLPHAPLAGRGTGKVQCNAHTCTCTAALKRTQLASTPVAVT